jgi:hypothetical protein
MRTATVSAYDGMRGAAAGAIDMGRVAVAAWGGAGVLDGWWFDGGQLHNGGLGGCGRAVGAPIRAATPSQGQADAIRDAVDWLERWRVRGEGAG